MAKKLTHKNCIICNEKIYGKKRLDRGGYYYPTRCANCIRKPINPEAYLESKLKALQKAREKNEKPIGSRRKHESSPNVFYWVIKTKPTGRWEYEHRIVTNAPKGSHVHHISGNTLDNRLENLIVLSPSEHIKHHNCIFKWSKLFDSCVGCGTTTKRHLSHGFCTTCYQRRFTNEKQKIKRRKAPS
jgi:hypothetical protein